MYVVKESDHSQYSMEEGNKKNEVKVVLNPHHNKIEKKKEEKKITACRCVYVVCVLII